MKPESASAKGEAGDGASQEVRSMASSKMELLHGMVAGRSRQTGFVLLANPPLRALYANRSAVEVLTYPSSVAPAADVNRIVTDRIRLILPMGWTPGADSQSSEFMSGKRRYVFRGFSLSLITRSSSANDSIFDGVSAIGLLERAGSAIGASLLVERFHFTVRERETLDLLALGLTNKEIASRLQISPHTVKAFVRAIMFKTGASTRSGILGKCTASLERLRP